MKQALPRIQQSLSPPRAGWDQRLAYASGTMRRALGGENKRRGGGAVPGAASLLPTTAALPNSRESVQRITVGVPGVS